MKKLIFLIIVSAHLMMLAAPAAALDFGVRAAFWLPSLSGNLTVDKNNVSGTTLDFTDDLDTGRIGLVPWIEAWFGIGPHHHLWVHKDKIFGDHTLIVGYIKTSSSGVQKLGTAIFNGAVYTGQDAEFTMDFSIIDVTTGYKLIDTDTFLAGFDITLLGNVKYIDIDIRLESGSLKNTVNADGFIPSLGAQVHVQIMMDILEARAVFLTKPYGDAQVTDMIFELSLTPLPFLDFSIGWRTMTFKISKDNMELNHRLSGIWLGASISF